MMNRVRWTMQVIGWVDYRVSRTRRTLHSLYISMVSRGCQGVGRNGNHEHEHRGKGVRERQVITCGRNVPAEQYIPSPFPITFPQKQYLTSPGLIDVEAEAEDAYPNTPSSWASIGISSI
jgi:hypothetical protein